MPEGTADEGEFDCMISPNEMVDIGSAITGQIGSIYVERGDYVEAGQMLAMLESSVEEAAVRVARARADRKVDVEASKVNLELSRKRRERAEALYESKSLSRDLDEQAATEAQLAELQLKRSREDHRLALLELERASAALKRRAILSPISGLVIERLMAPGEVVERETILRIAEIDVLRVQVILPSELITRVKAGDAAEIVPEAPYDQPRRAEVAIVDRIIDGASGTFGVRLNLPNDDHALPAGLRCKVRFASK
jgi:RND family efflux transporter MFP subunit